MWKLSALKKFPARLGMAILCFFLADPAVSPAADFNTSGSLIPQAGLRGGASSGSKLSVHVKSVDELRWQSVVRQKLDIGCGAAALATILTYYFDFPTTEAELFEPLLREALRQAGPDVKTVGFNLRHIRDVAARGGLAAAAFRVEVSDLARIRIPGIARLTIKGYDHFAVFKEARGGRVYLADPAFGNTSYRLASFKKIWSGVMMGFTRRTRVRNLPQDHLLVVKREDERGIDADEIMRTTRSTVLARAPFAQTPTFGSFSTFAFVQPQVRGTESIFPVFLFNSLGL